MTKDEIIKALEEVIVHQNGWIYRLSKELQNPGRVNIVISVPRSDAERFLRGFEERKPRLEAAKLLLSND